MLSSPSDALNKLGGPKVVSHETRILAQTVNSWAERESIPPDTWPELVGLADKRGVSGITYEALALAHAKVAKPRKRKPKPRKRGRA